jgi:membrane protease YdiL (CAAX protease family)
MPDDSATSRDRKINEKPYLPKIVAALIAIAFSAVLVLPLLEVARARGWLPYLAIGFALAIALAFVYERLRKK